MDMTMESCRSFVEVLASDAPAPGGGGAAALAGAIGTALGNMVGSLTVGRKKYAGVLNSLTAEFVRPGQVVMDVSINWDENKINSKGGRGAIAGDAAFTEVEKIVDAITPVPGGVGAVTTPVLMKHVVEAAEKTETN